jgi:hypothetical protein
MIRDPRIWKLGHGTKVVFEFAAKSVEPYLAAIESCGEGRSDARARHRVRGQARTRETRHAADHGAFATGGVSQRA